MEAKRKIKSESPAAYLLCEHNNNANWCTYQDAARDRANVWQELSTTILSGQYDNDETHSCKLMCRVEGKAE